MDNIQSGILADVPAHARFMSFSQRVDGDSVLALRALCDIADGDSIVVGLGASLVKSLNQTVKGLRYFPVIEDGLVDVPSTSAALWCWVRGNDAGDIVHLARKIEMLVIDGFELQHAVNSFKYDIGRDLSGYEDGTENPKDQEAVDAAFLKSQQPGLNGSSFVAVQQWAHNLDVFESLSQTQQDNTIGRRISDNEEIDDAPESAHVKRTAQESFSPEAFVVRRSMPWADATEEGLVFVAFGHSFDAYEALLKQMVGANDGIVDALFSFTTPITGAYFWCPPLHNGKLDLRAIGL